MASISAPQPTEDYKRLQQIEQKVIQCVQIAAQVTEHFSRVGRTAELAGAVQQLCTKFMTTIAEALQLVKEGAEASTGEHRLELHAYHSLARAHINTEKLQVLGMHLQSMQAELEGALAAEQAQEQEQGPGEDVRGGGAPGEEAGPGGGGPRENGGGGGGVVRGGDAAVAVGLEGGPGGAAGFAAMEE